MATLTQHDRLIAVETPLGKDALVLSAFDGQEQLSRLFSYRLDVLSKQDAIDPKRIVGQRVGFNVLLADGRSRRHFNGFVSRLSAGENETGMRRYTAEVVPWLWFLTRTSDCRVFQEQTIPQIIESVFRDLGFTDFETGEIREPHPKWDYCVQYRETDFNFVSRLMEQEGIFYYFRHEEKRHVLVLADQKAAHKDCPEKEVEHEYSDRGQARIDRITSWDHRYEFTPGKWVQTDYNFETHPARSAKTPATLLLSTAATSVQLPGRDKYEMFDYPAEYEKKSPDGEQDTKVRMQEDDAAYDTVSATSTCRTFTCGGKFKLKKHAIAAEQGAYVITSINHSASAALDGPADYSNSFTAIPESVTFRPLRTTPKPTIQGVQTAVVTGPAGEEIWPDKYGRVKLQFFWDRYGKRDDKTSCWVRCAQASAGKGWGSMFLPRVGQEVVVTFEEGDPDYPLVVGCVYNDDQKPFYTLPDEKTKSYLKTNSTKGGDGYNEIRFEDKKDKEQIYIHSQRNMDTRVRNDSLERIFGNRHQIIGYEKDGKKGGDQRELIYQDQHLNIKRNQVEHVEGNVQLTVGKGDAQDGGNVDLVIEKKKTELIEGENDLHIKLDRNEKIDGTASLTVGKDQHAKIGMNYAVDSGQTIHIKAGMTLVLEAGTQLTLKVGGNFIDISPAGVAIQGTMVLINSGGAPGTGAGAKPKAPHDAKPAKPTKPDLADESKTGQKSSPDLLS